MVKDANTPGPNARTYPEHPPVGSTPAVSHSAIHAFSRCERRWGYQYLTNFLPTADYGTVSIQKRIKPSASLAGSIFHLVCESAARDYLSSGVWPTDLVDRARRHYQGYVAFSRQFRQSIADGLGPIYDDDYQAIDEIVDHGRIDPHGARVMAAHIRRWLENFQAFADAELLPRDRSEWRLPERGDRTALPWFWGGAEGTVAVYSVYDLAMASADGAVTIYDWKTGMRSEGAEDAARRQLAFYAAFAMSYWNTPLESIEVVVYWPDEPYVTRSDVSEKQMAALTELCDRYHALFQERKRQAFEDQDGFLGRLPMTDTVADCQRCPFTGCTGRARLAAAPVDPDFFDPFAIE